MSNDKTYLIPVPERLFQDFAEGARAQAKVLREAGSGEFATMAPRTAKDFRERADMLDAWADSCDELHATEPESLPDAMKRGNKYMIKDPGAPQ